MKLKELHDVIGAATMQGVVHGESVDEGREVFQPGAFLRVALDDDAYFYCIRVLSMQFSHGSSEASL
jgi:hypothetical protein